jgi:RNA polymerase sigma-70 factor (ECF subfamily)
MGAVVDVDEAAALRAGGREAFDDLFRRHGATVLRYARRLTDDPGDAEELTQETFLALWTKHRTVRTTGGSLLPWLLVTCRHHGANLLRRTQRRRQESAALSDVLEYPAPVDPTAWDWLRDAIAALDEIDQAIVLRCLIDGVPYRDAAAELGLTVAAVAKRVQRVRTRLRQVRNEQEALP